MEGWKVSAVLAGATVVAAAWAAATERPHCQLPVEPAAAWTPIPPTGPAAAPMVAPVPAAGPVPTPVVTVSPEPAIPDLDWDDCPACGMG